MQCNAGVERHRPGVWRRRHRSDGARLAGRPPRRQARRRVYILASSTIQLELIYRRVLINLVAVCILLPVFLQSDSQDSDDHS